MKIEEVGAGAAAIGNQISAGIPIDQAVMRMIKLQPRYAEEWQEAANGIHAGKPLSNFLDGMWPASFIEAVKAGEEAGSLDYVLSRIEATVEIQIQLRNSMLQLAYPFGVGLGGLMVFIGFMLFVLPSLTKALNTNSNSFFIKLSQAMVAQLDNNWAWILAIFFVAVVAIVSWAKTDDAKKIITEFFLSMPVLGEALRDMCFGLWAHYMSMMVASGLSTSRSLQITSSILPHPLKESIDAFEKDLSAKNKTLSQSADFSSMDAKDPRANWWPFYISNAFVIAEQTGAIDKELMRVAPSLIKDGTKTLGRAIAILNFIALVISATLIVSPLAAYYIEIFNAIREVGI